MRVGRDPLLAAPVRLMAALAEVPVDLAARVEPLLLLGGERRDRRRGARLPRPGHPREQR